MIYLFRRRGRAFRLCVKPAGYGICPSAFVTGELKIIAAANNAANIFFILHILKLIVSFIGILSPQFFCDYYSINFVVLK